MEALVAVLRARFGTRPAGHWVTFRATIAGVKVFALAYAWSQRGISYFFSTCGRTDPHPIKYKSNFEDDFGVIMFKELNRPHIAHFLYDYLPLIDEHNKQRQNLLNLERIWKTNNCWMRLVTTILGMSVVDFQRCIRNRYIDGTVPVDNVVDVTEETRVLEFSDQICKWLSTVEERKRASPRIARRRGVMEGSIAQNFSRITDSDGNITRAPTEKQASTHGRSTGNAYTRNCFVCRMYLNEKGKTTMNTTQWWCKYCHMPLCKTERNDGNDSRRTATCAEMHFGSDGVDELICREEVTSKPFVMPSNIQVPFPMRSGRNST
jgi:hypothetical protein